MKAMRLIDAEALRGELLAEIGECLDNKTGQGRRFGLEAALRTLANAPTVDVPQRLTRDGVLAAVKALVVRQPWATLIALGIKTIETRPGPPNGPMRPDGARGLPGCTLERGERIAIVAGAQKPTLRHEVHWGARDDPTDPLIEANEAPWLWTDYDDGTGGAWQWRGGPLGAVVCTVVVADALPIVQRVGSCIGPAEWDGHRRFFSAPHEGYLTTTGPGAELPRYTDQLPRGDFTPGRWGWMLTDPRPCEPIPCKGRQGVFELPADVAGAIS